MTSQGVPTVREAQQCVWRAIWHTRGLQRIESPSPQPQQYFHIWSIMWGPGPGSGVRKYAKYHWKIYLSHDPGSFDSGYFRSDDDLLNCFFVLNLTFRVSGGPALLRFCLSELGGINIQYTNLECYHTDLFLSNSACSKPYISSNYFWCSENWYLSDFLCFSRVWLSFQVF